MLEPPRERTLHQTSYIVNDTNNPAWSRGFAIPFWHFTNWLVGVFAKREIQSRCMRVRLRGIKFKDLSCDARRLGARPSEPSWELLINLGQYHRECMKYELYDIVPKNWSCRTSALQQPKPVLTIFWVVGPMLAPTYSTEHLIWNYHTQPEKSRSAPL